MMFALRNRQMLALIIIALLTFLVIASIILGAVFHINILHLLPGKTVINQYN